MGTTGTQSASLQVGSCYHRAHRVPTLSSAAVAAWMSVSSRIFIEKGPPSAQCHGLPTPGQPQLGELTPKQDSWAAPGLREHQALRNRANRDRNVQLVEYLDFLFWPLGCISREDGGEVWGGGIGAFQKAAASFTPPTPGIQRFGP